MKTNDIILQAGDSFKVDKYWYDLYEISLTEDFPLLEEKRTKYWGVGKVDVTSPGIRQVFVSKIKVKMHKGVRGMVQKEFLNFLVDILHKDSYSKSFRVPFSFLHQEGFGFLSGKGTFIIKDGKMHEEK